MKRVLEEKGASLPAINNWIRQAGHHASASDYGGVQMLALSQDASVGHSEALGGSHIAQLFDASGTFSG